MRNQNKWLVTDNRTRNWKSKKSKSLLTSIFYIRVLSIFWGGKRQPTTRGFSLSTPYCRLYAALILWITNEKRLVLIPNLSGVLLHPSSILLSLSLHLRFALPLKYDVSEGMNAVLKNSFVSEAIVGKPEVMPRGWPIFIVILSREFSPFASYEHNRVPVRRCVTQKYRYHLTWMLSSAVLALWDVGRFVLLPETWRQGNQTRRRRSLTPVFSSSIHPLGNTREASRSNQTIP